MPPSNLTAHKHTQSTQGLDEGLLTLPSPYHDEFSLPPVSPTQRRLTVSFMPDFTSYLPSLLERFTYRNLSRQDDHDDGHNDESTSQGYSRNPHHRHVHWANTSSSPGPHHTNWLLVLSLLLFLSITINSFLLFEARGRHYAPVPHDAYRVKELGQKYTCYHTHKTSFQRVDAYERLDGTCDHYWKDILGGSDGYIYTAFNRPDGQVRKARFGMFHQLECLYRIRRALSSSMIKEKSGGRKGKKKRKDLVFVDDQDGLEGPLAWRHCFDYLRQTVLCGADDTVETSEEKEGEWKTFGYGSRRQCRDSKWLFDVTKCGERGCEGGPFYQEEEKTKG